MVGRVESGNRKRHDDVGRVSERTERDEITAKPGLLTSAGGLLVSAVGTILLFLHATDESHSAIQGMGTIAVAYLGVVLLGVSMSVTGVALLSAEEGD